VLTYADGAGILEQVAYKPGWEFRALYKGDGFLLQVRFIAPCEITGRPERQAGRKWYVSAHACRSEVVATALKAVLTAEEHEARERFTYKGCPVYHPHLDVEAMVKAGELSRDVRAQLDKMAASPWGA